MCIKVTVRVDCVGGEASTLQGDMSSRGVKLSRVAHHHGFDLAAGGTNQTTLLSAPRLSGVERMHYDTHTVHAGSARQPLQAWCIDLLVHSVASGDRCSLGMFCHFGTTGLSSKSWC